MEKTTVKNLVVFSRLLHIFIFFQGEVVYRTLHYGIITKIMLYYNVK